MGLIHSVVCLIMLQLLPVPSYTVRPEYGAATSLILRDHSMGLMHLFLIIQLIEGRVVLVFFLRVLSCAMPVPSPVEVRD